MNCCKSTFEICEGIPNCLTELTIVTSVISGDITFRFVDKFNKVFYVDKTTDAEGVAVVYLTQTVLNDIDLPIGFFNPYSDITKIFIVDQSAEIVKWSIDGTDYDSISIHVSNTISNPTTYELNPFIL